MLAGGAAPSQDSLWLGRVHVSSPGDKLAAQVLRVWDSVKARPHVRWVLSIVAGRPLAWNLPWSPF